MDFSYLVNETFTFANEELIMYNPYRVKELMMKEKKENYFCPKKPQFPSGERNDDGRKTSFALKELAALCR
jgi:hypothetical protein